MNKVFKALSHPVRRAVIKQLRDGAKTAGELAEAFDLTKPTMSGHFTVLKEAGLITAERDGTTIYYRLNASVAEDAAATLLDLVGQPLNQKDAAE